MAKELLFDAFFQKRDWPPALALSEELVRRRPDVAHPQKALIATLSNMKRYDEAIEAAQYIERHGEDLTVLDALKVAITTPAKSTRRSAMGSAASSCATPRPAKFRASWTMTEPSGPPSGDNVISFSLWGPAPVYSYGAMINLALCLSIYPDWICRFYIDSRCRRLRRLSA